MRTLLLETMLMAVLVLSAGKTYAFQCGDMLVHVGDSLADVAFKCGDPDVKQSRQETLTERAGPAARHETSILIDEWTYNPGPDAFMRYLRFENGRLVEIQAGDYGY